MPVYKLMFLPYHTVCCKLAQSLHMQCLILYMPLCRSLQHRQRQQTLCKGLQAPSKHVEGSLSARQSAKMNVLNKASETFRYYFLQPAHIGAPRDSWFKRND